MEFCETIWNLVKLSETFFETFKKFQAIFENLKFQNCALESFTMLECLTYNLYTVYNVDVTHTLFKGYYYMEYISQKQECWH